MLAIKLQRIGKKHQPSYRLVVAEKRSKMASAPVEDLGAYNPFTKTVTVNGERVSYWMKNGAQPTLTVHNILVAQRVLAAPKRAVKIAKKEAAAEGDTKKAAVAAAAPASEMPVAEEATTTEPPVLAEAKAEVAAESEAKAEETGAAEGAAA